MQGSDILSTEQHLGFFRPATLFVPFLHHSCVASIPFPRDRGNVAASANPLIKYFMLLTEQKVTGHMCLGRTQKSSYFPLKEEE